MCSGEMPGQDLVSAGTLGAFTHQGLAGYAGNEQTAQAKAVPIRERILKQAMSDQERMRRMLAFAERLTPEVEELIEVLKEGIRLGVISFDGSLTRY